MKNESIACGENLELPTKDNIVGREDVFDSFNLLINVKKELLFTEAELISTAYYAQHDVENDSRKHSDRGYVFCRTRLRNKDNYKNIEISWYKMKIVMSGNKRIKLSKHISKGKNTIYPASKFLRYAQDWEFELIEEAEKSFQIIRESLNSLKAVTLGAKSLSVCDKKYSKLTEDS